jgi:small multidrug resistance pump
MILRPAARKFAPRPQSAAAERQAVPFFLTPTPPLNDSIPVVVAPVSSPPMTYLFLLLAILCEAAWATSMKLAQGFTRPIPAAAMLGFYLASLVFLTLAARKLDLSIAYALWVGAGMSLIAIIGILYFREPVTPLKLVSLAFIAAGIVGLRLSGTGA